MPSNLGVVASAFVDSSPIYTQPTFRSSSLVESPTTNWTINAPSGTSAGDILVMVVTIYIDFKSGIYGSLASSGWTERASKVLVTGGFDYQRFWVYTKTAGASETSYSWTGGANWGGTNCVGVLSIAGGTGIDVVGSASYGTTAATAIGASITTTASPELLVFASGSIGMSYIAASPMTTRIKNTTSVQGGIFAATQTLSATGATGNRSFTSFGDGYPASSMLLSVK